MVGIYIAVEDALSEAIAIRLITEYTALDVQRILRKGGNGYLKSNFKNFCEIARTVSPVLLLTDLDSKPCAPFLIEQWSTQMNHPLPSNLLFRVAVREVEAWLLADHVGMQSLLQRTITYENPDALQDPKSTLLELAKRAPREIKQDLLPPKNAVTSGGVGLGYNSRLIPFVLKTWCPIRACTRSESLQRCVDRLKSFTPLKFQTASPIPPQP
jgi:hypothetical protein